MFVCQNSRSTLMLDRPWAYFRRIDRWSTLASCCKGPRQDLNGVGGRNFSSCCSITTVRRFPCGGFPVVLMNSLIVVMMVPREENGVTKYHVYQRASRIRSHMELQSFHLLCSPYR